MSGNIEERGKNTFRLVVSGGFDAHGKRIKYTRTFHGDKRGAKRALDEFAVDVAKGMVRMSCGISVCEWAKTWIGQQEKRLAPRTVASYRGHLQNRILPALGHIPLDKLQPRHINDFLEQMEQKGARLDGRGETISGATCLRHLRTLSVMLQEAVYRQLIPQNPARAVRAPRVKRKEARYYDERGVKLLIERLQSEPGVFRAMVLTAMLVGLRRGEIIGLEWSAVDWDKRTVTVRQSAQILAKSLLKKTCLPNRVISHAACRRTNI